MSKEKTTATVAPDSRSCNFRINHAGMGWPIGFVVQPHAFPTYPYRHIELGAISETTETPTSDDVPHADVASMPDDKLIEENKRLRGMLADLPQRAATNKAEVDDLTAKNEKLSADLAKANEDLSNARSVAGIKVAEAEQRKHESGAGVEPTKPLPAKK